MSSPLPGDDELICGQKTLKDGKISVYNKDNESQKIVGDAVPVEPWKSMKDEDKEVTYECSICGQTGSYEDVKSHLWSVHRIKKEERDEEMAPK